MTPGYQRPILTSRSAAHLQPPGLCRAAGIYELVELDDGLRQRIHDRKRNAPRLTPASTAPASAKTASAWCGKAALAG